MTLNVAGPQRAEHGNCTRLWSLFQSLPVGLVLSRPGAEVQYCNQAALDLLGVTEDELAGKTSFDPQWKCIREDGSPCAGADHPIPRAIATRRPVRNEELGVFRPAKQDWVWLLVNANPVFDADGAVREVICSFSDVTRRKQAEKELRAGEDRFRNAFADAATGMLLVDLEGRFVEANRAYCEITGYSQAELASLTFLAITHPEDLDKCARAFKQMLNGESSVIEKRYVRKDGGLVWARVSSTLLRDSRTGPCHAVAIVEDITERKRAEEELTALSRRLQHVQDEERRRLARELHDSTAQSVAALCMNLGVVSESANLLDGPAHKALQECREIAEQCIRELRTFSYLLHPPVLDDLGLSSALKWYVEGFAQRSRIEVALDIAPNLGRLPRELELTLYRVVQESLTNIHRHSGSRTAMIRIVRYANDVFLQVRDDGRGISDGSNTGDGTVARVGVGIAGMRERVRQAGGHLTIRSRPGGTYVEVLAPISPPPRVISGAASSQASACEAFRRGLR